MEIRLTGLKTLVLPSPAVAYIMDKLSRCPYNEVQALMADLSAQLQAQEVASKIAPQEAPATE